MKPLFTLKESTRYPGLFVRKYYKKVFWNNLWHTDSELLESRGHVFTKEGKLVVAPLTKIFNRHENCTDIPCDHMCLAIEKINGFMAAVTYVPEVDDVVISTTGSLDSDFVEYAREKISKEFIDEIRRMGKLNGKWDVTYIFEIVHEDDPHIIPETEGAYLIGSRVIDTSTSYFSNAMDESELDQLADQFNLLRPMWFVDRFSTIVDAAAVVKHEGFVVYDQDEFGKALKIKSPYYLSSKAIARCKDIFTLDKRRVDEEFYPLLNHIKNNVNLVWWCGLDKQAKLEFIREWFCESYF